jgi:DNA-binding transcriptional LysR family regulator
MARTLDWESRIGRRVRLRDLHVLFAVVQHRSMAGAGAQLGISQSAVSQSIAALEHALAVRLLDRTPRGVEPTMYADALIRRGRAAFDELRSGVKDIESLADPTVGEVRIGCSESISAGVLPPIIERLTKRHPRMVFEVSPANGFRLEFPELHERTADVVLSILSQPLLAQVADELKAEVLFDDRICLAAGAKSPWASRRKIDFADLVDASWIMPSTGAPGEAVVLEAFKARGLPAPQVTVKTFSVHLRNFLSMRGPFIVVLPASILRMNADIGLRMLPIELPSPPRPVVAITLKDRTLSPSVELFLDCAREVAKSLTVPQALRRRRYAAERK